MIVTIFGATGMVGNRLVKTALAMGYTVKAFGRNIEKYIDEDLRNEKFEAIKGYVFDEKDVYKAIDGSDAVISALGGSFDGTDKTRSLGMKNILQQMQKTSVQRIIAIGGMGVLKDDEYEYLMNREDYPEMYLPVGNEHLQAYLQLKATNLHWTFVCPPDIKDEDATGSYITNAEYPPGPNHYRIAAGDLACFMLDELKKNEFVKLRVGISN